MMRSDWRSTTPSTPRLLLALAVALSGCSGNDDASAKIAIVNGESGCTLSEVYIALQGDDKGSNLVAGDGITHSDAARNFPLEEGVYAVEVSSNTGTSNLDPTAECTVNLEAGETRTLVYSYAGGPSLFWGDLSGCD